MRKLANLFLVLFLLAAVVGLAAELLRQLTAIPFPPLLVQGTWLAVFLCGLLLYLCYGFNRHLPFLILLPLQLWLLWSLVDFWPLELAVGPPYRLYAAVAQLILGLIVLQLNRLINNRSRFFVQAQFAGPAFRSGRLLLFCLVNIFIFPVILLLIGFALTANMVESYSAGFVRLKPNGLYMTERSYRQGDKQIQLMGMVHLARPEYYTGLMAAIPQQHTLILMEGVTDKTGLLKEHFAYGKIADLLGLKSQGNIHFQGRLIGAGMLNNPEAGRRAGIDLLPADVDLSMFSPLTIKVLNALAKYVLNAASPLAGYAEFSRWAAQQNFPADFDNTIMKDLLDKRNRHVVAYVPTALKSYDHLVIPWGALHMKGIEQAVLRQGFVLEQSRERLSIDFLLLPYEQLWQGLAGRAE